MLATKWSRVVAVAVAGAAGIGGVIYRGRKVSALASWKEEAQQLAFKPAYNNAPNNYREELFKLSYEYPSTLPGEDRKKLPWMKVDFKTEPEKYLWTVLHYCFEGNTECDFRVDKNKVRPWYNAPWMAYRQSGREPIHGLTMERPANVGYIADTQKRWEQTWAVGFYNSYGAYTIGKFWEKPWEPTLTDNVKFPEGTVAFKLLFTEATEADVPSLAGSPEWQAAIAIPDPPIPPDASDAEAFGTLLDTMKPKDRGPNLYPLRLIQVDIMVRDSRADKETGWVFGTFMYHKDHGTKTKDKWRRLVPLCLQWGNDPDLTPERYYEQGIRPNETWTNPLVKEKGLLAPGRPYLGYLERANGIVDNFISCCASCHSTASIPTFPKTLTPSKPDLVPNTMDWFKNIHAGEPFEEGGKSLDYSLQLDSGLSGYFEWVKSKPKPK